MYTPIVYSGIMALTLYIYMMHRINCLKTKKVKKDIKTSDVNIDDGDTFHDDR